MVSEALEVAAREGNVHRSGRGLGPVGGGDRLEYAQVEIVDDGVGLQDVAGHFQVPAFQEHRELVRNDLVLFGHLAEGLGHGRGDDRRRESEAGQLGDVPGEVAHPLQRGAHPEGANDHPEVARYRALQGEDVDGAFIQAVLEEIDPGIRGNDVFGQINVRHLEGRVGLLHGLADQLGNLNELLTHLGQLFLKNLTHGGVLSLESRPHVADGIHVAVRHSNP
ncbi:MAG: hypothetical protein JWR71_1193 [Pseudarthrobacter sp.]|nr:hypothetical protein [Pseudarthrobacter sp.]